MHVFRPGEFQKFIVHHIGNKSNGDGARFSETLTDTSRINGCLNQLIESNFKSEELYQFHFIHDVELNPMNHFASLVFQNSDSFIEQSKNIGRLLYDKSTHPQIKGGELCLFYLKDCQLNDDIVDCIGLFKSETKDTVLKIDVTNDGYGLTDVKGINTRKIDKGCLIFNTESQNGYLISLIDNTNRNTEAQYWKDDFLGIQNKKNEYHYTNQFLGLTKQFVTKELSGDNGIEKADQINYLNRSVEYFKNHECFDKTEFENQVFQNADVIESFNKFDQIYREQNEVTFSNEFGISKQAVKKQARSFKSVLKLDKNFHIYIHGNRDMIEQGVDSKGRKYYKIYYDEES
ncbi:nucleoid associated protein NdpA [Roseivirga pacifica]|uniref:Nucleoid-associated protein n=1 Tax=Roseivirga pacifica TaxID=1267423 RepID=A0A1I0MR31_9BACT|nr:nucleoid-associated protein [Roseivirga pacifica]RKQ50609.1 nucleoid associated protein NdpA [Roseivirga pacifica]SEV90747.1 hypothetical protein SAMN05216290_0609 [Roseivirga pacifica]